MLVDEVICRYGVPSTLHSDRGANLTSQVMTALCKYLGVVQTQTSTYRPQGNGQVKHFNCTLEAILSKMVKENQKDWDLHIPKTLFVTERRSMSPLVIPHSESILVAHRPFQLMTC